MAEDILMRLRLADEFTATFTKYQSQLAKTSSGGSKAGSSWEKAFSGARKAISDLGPALSGLGVATVVFNQGAELVKKFAGTVAAVAAPLISVNSQLDNARVRLTALGGSTEGAAQELDFLRGVAAQVPFTMQSVIDAGVTLKAFGADIKTWTPAVADLATVMGTDAKEAADALGRAFAGGAGSADILRERGILELVKSFAKVDDLSKLSLPQFREALLGALVDPAGKIAGAAGMAAQTWDGKMSMMSDAADRFKLMMTERLWPGVNNALQNVLNKVSEFEGNGTLREWATAAEEAMTGMWNGFIEAVPVAIKTVGFVVQSIAGLGAVWDGVKMAIQGVLAVQAEMLNMATLGLVPAFKDLAESTKEVFLQMKEEATKSAGKVAEIGAKTDELARKAAEVGESFKVSLGENAKAAVDQTAEGVKNLGAATGDAKKGIDGVGESFTGALAKGKELQMFGPQLAESTVTAAKSMADAIDEIVNPMAKVEQKQNELKEMVNAAAREMVARYGNEPGGIADAINAAPAAMEAWVKANSDVGASATELTTLLEGELNKYFELVKDPLVVKFTSDNEPLLTNIKEGGKGGTIGMEVAVEPEAVVRAMDNIITPPAEMLGQRVEWFTADVEQAAKAAGLMPIPFEDAAKGAGSSAMTLRDLAVAADIAANELRRVKAGGGGGVPAHHAGYFPDGNPPGEHIARILNSEVVTPREKFYEHGKKMLAIASGRMRSERSRSESNGPSVVMNINGYISRDVVRDLHSRFTRSVSRRELNFGRV